MSELDPTYLQIPTIPSDFIRQMVAHLDHRDALGEDCSRQLAQLLNRSKVSIADYVGLFGQLSAALDDEMLGFLPHPVPP